MEVICRRGDQRLSTDRLDPILVTMLINERHHYFGLRSSSAWTKKAAALRRISLARLSSRFSRSSCLSRCSLALATEEVLRGPADRLQHDRNVSGVHPILPAIEQIAGHWEGYSSWCSTTNRTARFSLRDSISFVFS